jgi:hypothetical protein
MLIYSLDNILTFFPQQLSKNVTSVHFTRFLRQLYELKWDLDQQEKTMTIFFSLPNLHSHIWSHIPYLFFMAKSPIFFFLGHISTWVLERGVFIFGIRFLHFLDRFSRLHFIWLFQKNWELLFHRITNFLIFGNHRYIYIYISVGRFSLFCENWPVSVLSRCYENLISPLIYLFI